MLKRREFLKHSVVVATVASTGILGTKANATDALQERPIHFVVVDEELEDSVLFAGELIARGARAFAVQQDLGRLWFGELGAAFKAGHAIAGLTTHSELLVCSTFARQHGARVRFEGSHDCRGSDVLTHSLECGIGNAPIAAGLASAEADWPRALAIRLSTLSMCDDMQAESCATTTRRSASHPGSLFSWLITA